MKNELTLAMHAPVLNLSLQLASESTHEQAMKAADIVCDALYRQESSVQQLRVFLGRVIAVIQDRRLYAPAYATFEEFTTSLAKKHNLSRASVRESLMITRALPDLEPEQAENMPLTNLALVARASKGQEKKVVNGLLREAAKFSVVDFRERLEERELLPKRGRPSGPPRTTGKVTLQIVVAAKTAKQFRERAGDDPGKYLAQLLAFEVSHAG